MYTSVNESPTEIVFEENYPERRLLHESEDQILMKHAENDVLGI